MTRHYSINLLAVIGAWFVAYWTVRILLEGYGFTRLMIGCWGGCDFGGMFGG